MSQTILILHGALGSKEQLLPVTEALGSAFNTKSISFSGHGGVPFDGTFDINGFTEEVLTFMATENLEKVDIFGYSMGGYVALNLALKHPEKVGKIYTLGTKLEWSQDIAQKEIKLLDAEKIEEKAPAFAKTLNDRHAPTDWKEVLQKTSQMMISLGDGAALSLEEFKNISHQVIVGIGDEDNMVTIEESEKVANLLPQGSLQIFKGFKHPIEQIDVALLTAKITSFMQG
ncbi:alpha/beta hydrolase [Fulvivirga sp. 29W222]|uniref:Alpha/beta hydrolase n=1 Tax=Fulvivirga marina TaxID=2494733 RepID=A0A937KGU4_9BACT|nr:alpha/beta hydrolase [Fulvivirga marina]MBL6449538.1 alpha/beta hydrolase [Fulvivirga marina]